MKGLFKGTVKKKEEKEKEKEKEKGKGLSKLKKRESGVSSAASSKEIRNCPAPLPENEEERIKKLLEYNVLDTESEKAFDELTELTSKLFGTKTALVSIVDRERQWFKSRVGLDATQTGRDSAFCAHAILDQQNVLVVSDTHEDPRFAQNELVLGGPYIRFYAGAPLVTPDGYALGTLCAIDYEPREFSPEHQRALQILSHQVVAQLEISKHIKDLKETIVKLQSTQKELEEAKNFAEICSVSSFENLLLSPVGLEAFKKFLENEFCYENFEFWEEARDFRALFEKRLQEDNKKEAKRICETFVISNSIKQLNILDQTRDSIEKIQSAAENGKDIPIDIFDDAREEVFGLMKKDSYSKFVVSAQYRELMTTVKKFGIMRLEKKEGSS